MKLFFIFSILTTAFLHSCKKNYTCECCSMGGKGTVFTEKTTKEKAVKKCKDYENSETDCSIK